MTAAVRPRVGLALGSGSARGWAHFGVIRALEQAGIRPDLVCGTSIGALVGAVYASGALARLEQWALGLGLKDVVALMDLSLGSGLLKGQRLMDYFRRNFEDRPLEQLPMPFAAVATSLHTGAEVWLRRGSTFEAVRASTAIPGLFAPVLYGEELLVDGGLVNPVPVSLARAMGADVVIAVDLGSDLLGRHRRLPARAESSGGEVGEWMRKLRGSLGARRAAPPAAAPKVLSTLDVMTTSINIMQVRISRSRMAGDPPDVIVAPRLAHFGLLDFHRAQEAIDEGTRAVERVAHNLPMMGRHFS